MVFEHWCRFDDDDGDDVHCMLAVVILFFFFLFSFFSSLWYFVQTNPGEMGVREGKRGKLYVVSFALIRALRERVTRGKVTTCAEKNRYSPLYFFPTNGFAYTHIYRYIYVYVCRS